MMKLFNLSEEDAELEIQTIHEESRTTNDMSIDLFGLDGDA
ncbi:hypothetical protein [Streptococcus equi]|nr:hypothetical protein [Streptococcus equi]